MYKEKVIVAWSGGKNSALALHNAIKSEKYDILSLLTIVTRETGRIGSHGTRRELIELQAKNIGLPLYVVTVEKGATEEEYKIKMREAISHFRMMGAQCVIHGDVLNNGVRDFVEKNLASVGMRAIFPLWRASTSLLARRFYEIGFKGIVTCVDSKKLGSDYAGKMFDRNFISSLPSGVDQCGENGEFYTFVFDGPLFQKKINVTAGERTLIDNRWHMCDVTSPSIINPSPIRPSGM